MAAKQKRLMEEYGIRNIINYLRKSRQDIEREKKTGEDTLHEQKQLMDRVLSSYGVPYEQRPEIGSGDKISSRPVFQEIIKEIEQGKHDAIAVKEISRMGRGSYKDMGTIYDLIQEKRLFIITPYKIYDPTNPSDLRQIRFELFMSREEFETTRERMTGGRYNAAMEGKWVAGKAPYGYKYDPNTKHLVVVEEEAEVVRMIYDFYANGIILNGERKLVQFRALASYLTRLGIKTPRGKDWHPTRLKEFLSYERYIGRIKFRTTQRNSDGKVVERPESEHIVVEDAHEPIIDMETWEKVQARIENRDYNPRTKLEFDPCELAGLCVCKKCGRKMVRQYSVQHYKKTNGEKSIYHKEFLWCTTAGCTFVKYRNIEHSLLNSLTALRDLDDKELQYAFKHMTAEESSQKEYSQDDLLKQVELKKEELKRRRKFIFQKHQDGIYSDEDFITNRNEIDKELEQLEKTVIAPAGTPKEINPSKTRENITSVLEAYQKTTHKSARNAILKTVFDKVVVEVLEKGRGRKEAKHAIKPYLKADISSN